jgi:hypothetical protein
LMDDAKLGENIKWERWSVASRAWGQAQHEEARASGSWPPSRDSMLLSPLLLLRACMHAPLAPVSHAPASIPPSNAYALLVFLEALVFFAKNIVQNDARLSHCGLVVIPRNLLRLRYHLQVKLQILIR